MAVRTGCRRAAVGAIVVAMAGLGLSGCMSVGASSSDPQADLTPVGRTGTTGKPVGGPASGRAGTGQRAEHGASPSVEAVSPGPTPPPAAAPPGVVPPAPGLPGSPVTAPTTAGGSQGGHPSHSADPSPSAGASGHTSPSPQPSSPAPSGSPSAGGSPSNSGSSAPTGGATGH